MPQTQTAPHRQRVWQIDTMYFGEFVVLCIYDAATRSLFARACSRVTPDAVSEALTAAAGQWGESPTHLECDYSPRIAQVIPEITQSTIADRERPTVRQRRGPRMGIDYALRGLRRELHEIAPYAHQAELEQLNHALQTYCDLINH